MPGLPDSWRISMWKTLKEFVRAVGKWWWFVVIEEAIGIVIGTAQTFGHWSDLPRWMPSALCVLGLVAASFCAFYQMKSERDKAIEKLSENSAKFKGQFQQIIAGAGTATETATGRPVDITRLIVKMTISNLGAPSVAKNFVMKIKLASGHIIVGEPWWDYNEDIKVPVIGQGRSSQVLPHNRHLPTLSMNPIPRGGLVYGYVGAMFYRIDLLTVNKQENTVIVEFDDIEDRHFSCNFSATGTPNAPQIDLLPGDMGVSLYPPLPPEAS
jgi:hypothetical protein